MNTDKAIAALEDNLKGLLFVRDESYIENLISLGWGKDEAIKYATWDWPHGIGTYGLYRYYLSSGREEVLDYLEKWYMERIEFGLPGKNVNTVTPLYALTYIQEKRPHAEFERVMREWADWIFTKMTRTEYGGIQHKHAECENSQELWDDTLFMTVLFLCRAGILFNRPEYIEEARYQWLLHQKYLADNRSGLWFHAWRFDKRDNFADALWGRGNAWITVFVPEMLELIGKDDAFSRFMVTVLQDQVSAIERYQDASGLWHTLINEDTSYIETSASAGFVYGILRSVRLGVLDKKYLSVCKKAYPALLNEIKDDGTVANVSYGTNVGLDLDHYRNIPLRQMPYGQSLMILAVVECEKAEREGLF